MHVREYLAHRLIGTSLEGLAHGLRDLARRNNRSRYPELSEVYQEDSRIKLALARIIHNGMNCIDVGAHLGSVLQQIRRLSPDGTHLAIEPVPYKSRWLRYKYPEVRVLQLALNDVAGEADFFVHEAHSALSGLRRPPRDQGVECVSLVKVRCATLDEVVPADLSVGFIKLDVEGGELAALRGATSILDRSRPTVLFECTQTGLAAHHVLSDQIFDFFRARSYRVMLIKSWLADGAELTRTQFAQAMQYPFQAFNFLAAPDSARDRANSGAAGALDS